MNAVAQGHTASTSTQPQPAAQPTAEALLQVRGVSLEYRTPERVVRATHQVSFEVDPADRFVLLGPSGCGKSTLLKAVAGFIEPSEGEIRLAGHQVTEPGPDRIVVFQEFDQLPPWKTVIENVMFPLLASRTLKRPEALERARYYGKGRPQRVCRCLSAHLVRWHEGPCSNCPSLGHAAENPADG